MQNEKLIIDEMCIQEYLVYLKEQERSNATIQKYAHDLYSLLEFLGNKVLSKSILIDWKQELIVKYAPASVNTKLAAANGYLQFKGWHQIMLKPLKIQRSLFMEEEKELTREEYIRLVRAAQMKENKRLALVIQTICATGIRVSELKFITVEAVQRGRAEISNKGKMRI